MLDPDQFFRINRDMMVSFKSCVSFSPGTGKNLELIAKPKHVDENGITLEFVWRKRRPCTGIQSMDGQVSLMP